jgi:hypothetical protein
MAVVLTLNGSETGEGFLITPTAGTTFPGTLGLRTSESTHADATPKVVPGGAGVVPAQTQIAVTPVEHRIQIQATSASHSRNDTVLRVQLAGKVVASVKLTAIANPQIAFGGRFQARFALSVQSVAAPLVRTAPTDSGPRLPR